MTTYKKPTLFVILASATLTVMAGAVISPILNPMTEGLGVDPGMARVIITTHSIFIAFSSPFFGVLIDRIGPKQPFTLGLVLYGISGGAGLFINNYWLLLCSRALLGIGTAAIFTSITLLIFDLYEQGTKRNKIMSWRASSQSVGGIIWPLLGGFVGTFSWHFPFGVYFVSIPVSLLVLLYIPQVKRDLSIPTADKEKTVLGLLRENPTLFVTYGLSFLNMVLLYAFVVFLPSILKQLGVVSTFYVGLFISTIGIVAGISAPMYAMIRAKLSYKSIVAMSFTLWAASFIILSQASTTWFVLLSIALFGIGQGILMPAVQLWAGEMVPASFRGRITSYLGTFGLVGQFLSPIILSQMESPLGLNSVFLVVGITCAVLLVLFLTLFRER
jgi:ACDE family multidrug resistance protein